jgi:hypothetical protein
VNKDTSRPEAAFVLMLMQATLWAIAGLSAFPFVLAGEVFMIGLGLASILLAAFACILAVGLLKRQRRARRWAIGLEVTCLLGSLLQLTLPIGANHGPVSLMTNAGLPLAVILLLRGKTVRAAFVAAPALAGLQTPGLPLEGGVRVGGGYVAPAEVSQGEPVASGLSS